MILVPVEHPVSRVLSFAVISSVPGVAINIEVLIVPGSQVFWSINIDREVIKSG